MTDPPVRIDYEMLFRTGPGGVVIADANHIILQVNDYFLTWTGFTREELIGSTFERLLPPAERILFSSRTVPLLYLDGQISDISVSLLGKDRVAGAARLTASRLDQRSNTTELNGTDLVATTLFIFSPRRERTMEEEHLIKAVQHAEESDALRRAAQTDLAESTQYDPLTSLLSRAELLMRIAELVRDAPPSGEFSTFVLGLDHFRVVNESLGRSAGDAVLRTVAARLTTLSDQGFLCARVGDDEFVMVGPAEGQGTSFADTILSAVSAPILVDDIDIVVSASVGATITRVDPVERVNPVALAEAQVRKAGTAMYEAKAAGRNRWKLFASEVDDSAINEIRLLGEIRSALAAGQFRLEYQPQLDLRTGALHGYEALMRWDHPERGVVGPGGFINVAQKSGLISQVGTWACRTAIAQCALLNGPADAPPVTVSVNVSARQLGDPQLAEMVGALLAHNGLDPALLTLEITETGLITDTPRAYENLELLHEQGVRLSIDDFGTGHAGFAYLKDFPVDELKIDGSFVAGLGVSAEDTAIVTSCIDVAHAMGITVVAGGVETPEQLSHLEDLDCDIIQGYLYSMPMHGDVVQSWRPGVR